MTTRLKVLGIVAIVFAGAAIVLVWPLVSDAVGHGRVETTYASRDDFRDADLSAATSWLPADAQDLVVVSSLRNAHTYAIRFTASDSLDGSCKPSVRLSAPVFPIADTFDVYDVTSVDVCGDWAVARHGSTWVAWTPAAEAD